MLRILTQRLALSTVAITKNSMNAAFGGVMRRLVEDNDAAIETSVEFLARRNTERVPLESLRREDISLSRETPA